MTDAMMREIFAKALMELELPSALRHALRYAIAGVSASYTITPKAVFPVTKFGIIKHHDEERHLEIDGFTFQANEDQITNTMVLDSIAAFLVQYRHVMVMASEEQALMELDRIKNQRGPAT